jgi:hypothetical protein
MQAQNFEALGQTKMENTAESVRFGGGLNGTRDHLCIVATTDPEIFVGPFSTMNVNAVVFSKGADAIEMLSQQQCTHFFADFRALEDRWTGQRLVKHASENLANSGIKCWIMADSWHDHQMIWAMKLGANGMVKRNAQALYESIASAGTQGTRSLLTKQLSIVDGVFAKLAGPMHLIHTKAAKDAMHQGLLSPDVGSYVQALSDKFKIPGRREQFLKAIFAEIIH